MSSFFLDRPVFAWVIAIAMMLAEPSPSTTCRRPVPPDRPPLDLDLAFYPGASAKTVEDSVTQIIEQKMTGLDQMLVHAGDQRLGRLERPHPHLRARHRPRSRLGEGAEQAAARPCRCSPRRCQRQGLRVSKSTRNFLMIVGLTTSDQTWTQEDLSDFLITRVENVLARVPGSARSRSSAPATRCASGSTRAS